MDKTPGDSRGVSSVIGVIILVALVVTLGAVAGAFALDFTQQLHEPSVASVDASTITFDADGNEDCPSGVERACSSS